ncbi:ExbD/TolR family protein [Hydrocarboniphaga effusa]|uniref:ExbD/TolR family protein n=1 Tax=Hydrocarboniphaga effusa TaxID=243629 RepID=UPI003BAAA671|eukprot:TRINITY_DN948_c0_g1_i11.p2 TRINITY_DN948_c0_g1~~TRINITY_DN948_c0_g1_i11.p2  ORF type:complete len:143 (-),score=42.82 TRINITY_DN948_c0_g1_i11:87-515(-)
MGMQIGGDDEGEDAVVSAINTTPLVDVMLVLLIIFLITIPVVTQTIPVKLPNERNQALQTKPENIVIAIDKDGNMYWNVSRVADTNALFEKLKVEAVKVPQPEVHIRGDQTSRYQAVGQVMVTCQRAGIAKVGFILEPPPRG